MPWHGPERRQYPIDWFREELASLKQQTTDQHRNLRMDMNAGFDKLAVKLDRHQDEDDQVAARVLVIETERSVENRQVVKRSTWIALAVTAGLNLIGLGLRWIAGRP